MLFALSSCTNSFLLVPVDHLLTLIQAQYGIIISDCIILNTAIARTRQHYYHLGTHAGIPCHCCDHTFGVATRSYLISLDIKLVEDLLGYINCN